MIGDTIAEAMPELQSEAESQMVTPCRVGRPSTTSADPETGADVHIAGDPVFAGGCKIQTRQTQPRDAESGQGTVSLQSLEVHLPVDSGPYRVGDVVDILDRPDSPAAVVVRQFRIEGTHRKTWQTAQRLPVVEVG